MRNYTPNGEVDLWNYINTHQDEDIESIGEKFNMTKNEILELTIFWGSGNRQAFNKRFFELFEGSPADKLIYP